MNTFPEPEPAEVIDLNSRRSAPNANPAEVPTLEVILPESTEKAETTPPDEPPVLAPYQLAVKAIRFYQNSGTIIPGLHGEAVQVVKEQIKPPPARTRSDLQREDAVDYYSRFFELGWRKLKTAQGEVVAVPEDPLEAAAIVSKKTTVASTVLGLMLDNPKKKEIPTKAISFTEVLLKEIIRRAQQGGIKLD